MFRQGQSDQVWKIKTKLLSVQFSHFRLFVTPWTAACQASLSITNSQSLFKLMSIELVMPSNHLILCWPLLLPPSIFPSIRGFSKESVLHIRWPKYWSFSFSISPSNEYSGLISFRMDGVTKSRKWLNWTESNFVFIFQTWSDWPCLNIVYILWISLIFTWELHDQLPEIANFFLSWTKACIIS